MTMKCKITGKKTISARNISHAHNVTNRWQKPNLRWKRIFVPELGRTVRVRLSTRALRTVDKKGLMATLRDNGLTLKDIA